MLSLWNTISNKLTWKEKKYDVTVAVCVCLTNYNVGLLPLRSADVDWYTRYSNRMIRIGVEKKKKRAEVQIMPRARRAQQWRAGFRSANANASD